MGRINEMSNILMVPIHLDALFLTGDRLVTEARADFSRLPYSNGTRDKNPDIANISESVLSEVFEDQNLTLKKGIHLHWSLPDALTRGIQDAATSVIDYPAVPNRWLVTRRKNSVIKKQWIVESDYLHPEGQDNTYGGIVYPFDLSQSNLPSGTTHQPFRYLGRKIPFNDWPKAGTPSRLEKLTAVGYGEPAFAAFYPNCHSVFGCYDPDVNQASSLTGLQYDVIGWYSNKDQDPFHQFMQSLSLTGADEIVNAVKEEFTWQTTVDPADKPDGMICYARITFEPGTNLENQQQKQAVKVALGNTGTEALSAFLANELDPGRKQILEEQLEALQLLKKVGNRKLDIGPKFNESFHEKEFTAVGGGTIWTIHPETAGGNQQEEQTQVTLPPDLAHDLNALNGAQAEYDRACEEIKSMRHLLFIDWYKYMMCAYPPDDSRDDYPDIDRVKFYIENNGIPALREKLAQAGQLKFRRNQKIKDLIRKLAAQAPGFVLRQQTAPRYWQPNEPVVLLSGDAVKPGKRHGFDGRQHEDNLLQCQTLSITGDSITTDNFPVILAEIDKMKPGDNEEKIGFSTWETQPWHPFMLEWQVEVFPAKLGGNLDPGARSYEEDFITTNFSLDENQPELSVKDSSEVVHGAAIYSGSTILTPHAKIKLTDTIENYLKNLKEKDCYRFVEDESKSKEENRAKKLAYDKKFAEWFEKKPTLRQSTTAGFKTWYQSKPVQDDNTIFSSLTPEEKTNDAIYTAIRANEKLKDKNILSQSLGGFNAALLMQKQTMQLPIADPLGFDDYQSFTGTVKDLVQKESKTAPLPLNDFMPIRCGVMNILELRVIDTFGQIKADLDPTVLVTPGKLRPPDNFSKGEMRDRMLLTPRLAQPARLNFRWLSADYDDREMNAHPASNPVCGWLLPNNLDNSIMVYHQDGHLMGLIDQNADWESAPGSDVNMAIENIANPHLRKVIQKLAVSAPDDDAGKKQAFLKNFISVLDKALENIDPESFIHHQDTALLMGRPIAVVRASVNLEVRGKPAVNHNWQHLYRDMVRGGGQTDNFDRVKFPIRIGERGQLNDGVVGYWKEDKDNGLGTSYYTTVQREKKYNENIKVYEDAPLDLVQAIEDDPRTLTLLIDPRGKVHATCGILPAKVVDIPPDQYTPALQAIDITFLSTPILTPRDKIALPLPNEPGYAWSWLYRDRFHWHEVSTIGIVKRDLFVRTFEYGAAIWEELKEKGWIEEIDSSRAKVVPQDQRKEQQLSSDFAGKQDVVQAFLDRGHIVPVDVKAAFADGSEVREGWLKLAHVPGEEK
jgi:hypothetical protein